MGLLEGKPGGLEARCGAATLAVSFFPGAATASSVCSRPSGEEEAWRDRCTGAWEGGGERMPLAAPRTACASQHQGGAGDPTESTQVHTHGKKNLGKEIILGFVGAPVGEMFYFLWPG